MIDFEKELEEVLKDSIFDTDTIAIGNIEINRWVHFEGTEQSPKYWAKCDGFLTAEHNDLWELLRKLFC